MPSNSFVKEIECLFIRAYNTNDIIANMSKALAKSLLCTSSEKINIQSPENKNLGEPPVRTMETQLVLRKKKISRHPSLKNRTPFVSIPLQLFPSLEYSF